MSTLTHLVDKNTGRNLKEEEEGEKVGDGVIVSEFPTRKNTSCKV